MWYNSLLEKDLIPDVLIRLGIRQNCKQRLTDEMIADPEQQQKKMMHFVAALKKKPIAEEMAAANEQHYEVPTQFFKYVLGSNLKYSCAYWNTGTTTLDHAEDTMLELTTVRAQLKNHQSILECGCGWGSLSLYMAKKYPESQITAVSNSRTQKLYVDEQARLRGLTNLTVVTADMNEFFTDDKFDRIVSVEMFEHMRNYQSLLKKLSSFLYPDGKLFIHIFTHREFGYFYDVKDESDWMSKYFFTGGVMPSDHLLLYFTDHVKIKNHWRVSGIHYAKTSEAWLQNMDRHKSQIMPLFESTYGKGNALKWWVYWRIFFMACAELWKFRKGEEWFVSHYLFDNRNDVNSRIAHTTETEYLWNR